MIKILAIDDKKDNLISLKAIINDALPESMLFTALNGSKGIELAFAKDPDVILLDIVMPGMDGFEVCHRLKQEDRLRDIPVVFLTAIRDDKGSRIKALEIGAEAFLSKPIDETELTAQIRAMVKIKLANRLKQNEQKRLAILVAERTQELEKSQIATLNALNELKAENIVRKQAEIALRKSEEIFRILYNNSPDMLVSVSPENDKILLCNRTILKNTGYARKEIVGSLIFKMYHEDCMKGVKEANERFAKTGKITDTELILRRKDGSKIDVNLNASSVKDETGNILYSIYSWRDITERKLAEQIIIDSEERYHSLYDSMAEGFARCKMIYENNEPVDFKYLEVNNSFEKLTGLKNVVGKKISEILVNLKVENPELFELYARVAQTGISEQIETFVKPLGIWYSISTYSTEKDHFLVIFNDITDRKQASILIGKQNLVFSAINELFIKSMACKTTYEVAQICLSIALKVTNSQYGSVAEINSNNHFDTLALSDMGWEECKMAMLDPSCIHDMEIRGIWKVGLQSKKGIIINDPSGHPKSVGVPVGHPPLNSFLAMPFGHSKFKGMIGVANKDGGFDEADRGILEALSLAFAEVINNIRNQEDLLKSEERFKQVSESTGEWIWEIDTKGVYTYSSSPSNSLLGYHPEEIIGKKHFYDFFAPDVREKFKKAAFRVFVKKESFSRFENPNIHKDGHTVILETNAFPILDDNGDLIGYRGADKDITKLKQAEFDLIAAKEKAEESDRLKTAFLANMSHEIRTPMNGILGFAELLKEPNLTGEQQLEYIDIIEKGGARMLNTINDIVSISKIESGQIDVNLQESNINQQIEYIYIFFKTEIEGKGMHFSFGKSLPLGEFIIKTDREKVYAILTNLVKNAIKYTDKGSIEFGYNQKGKFLEFYVKDTGIGISDEKQEAIFERFIQADITAKMARQGSGLGLSISKAYVEMLGGKIWVESQSGKGSTFYFTLPCQTVSIDNGK